MGGTIWVTTLHFGTFRKVGTCRRACRHARVQPFTPLCDSLLTSTMSRPSTLRSQCQRRELCMIRNSRLHSHTNDDVQVMMDGMEDSLLLHWATISSQSAPETLSLRLSEYTTDAPGALASSRASDLQHWWRVIRNVHLAPPWSA